MTHSDAPAAPVDESAVEELIARAVAGFNAHDADQFLSIMADDVLIDHSAWPEPLRGKAQARTFYTDFIWKAFPDAKLERADGPFLHPHAPRMALAWRVAGTHSGPIDPPGFAATGKTIDLALREIAELHNGLVMRLQIQLDMATLLRQLGILPVQNSRAERGLALLQRLQTRALTLRP